MAVATTTHIMIAMKKTVLSLLLLSSLAGMGGDKLLGERNSMGIPSSTSNGEEIIRILAIGNSFSEDAVDQYFHEICAAAGKRVVVGDLYIPGCPLERHHLNAQTDSAAYRYRRIGLDGVTITASPVSWSRW